VTRGKQSAVVSADFDERGGYTITIDRGDGIGSYVLVAGGKEKRDTKLGGEVPEHIQKLLSLPLTVGPGDTRVPLGFASQFDPQFLLDGSSPAQVARVFGELTGVDLVFKAARESNRLRLETASSLKVCQGELARVKLRAQVLVRVTEDRAALEVAESHAERAFELQAQCFKLASLIRDAQVARVSLIELDSEIPAAVDVSAVDGAADRLRLFRELVREAVDVRSRIAILVSEEVAADQHVTEAEVALRELLEEAGVCPTCGSVISKDHADH